KKDGDGIALASAPPGVGERYGGKADVYRDGIAKTVDHGGYQDTHFHEFAHASDRIIRSVGGKEVAEIQHDRAGRLARVEHAERSFEFRYQKAEETPIGYTMRSADSRGSWLRDQDGKWRGTATKIDPKTGRILGEPSTLRADAVATSPDGTI